MLMCSLEMLLLLSSFPPPGLCVEVISSSLLSRELCQDFPWLSVGEMQPEDVFISLAKQSPKFKHFDQHNVKHFDWIKTICIFIRDRFGCKHHTEISCLNINSASFLSEYTVSLSAFCFTKVQPKSLSILGQTWTSSWCKMPLAPPSVLQIKKFHFSLAPLRPEDVPYPGGEISLTHQSVGSTWEDPYVADCGCELLQHGTVLVWLPQLCPEPEPTPLLGSVRQTQPWPWKKKQNFFCPRWLML